MDKAKSSFNIEKGVWRYWGWGGWNFVCVLGALKNRWGQGEGVKSDYRTKGLTTWAGLTCFAEIPAPSLNATKYQLSEYVTSRASPVSWDPSIVMPGYRLEIFQVIMLAGLPSEWTKRETGQRVTHCSCPLLPRLMWSGPYEELYCHADCLESFGICRFRGSN